MEMNTLRELYVDELKDIYNAENQLIKALPKLSKAASSEDLRSAFDKHLDETRTHIERLEEIFNALDESPKGKKCKGMEGLLAEGAEKIEEDADDDVKDAGLIGAAQRVEHYEIAAYGCVRTYAQLLGEDAAADLLQQTLDEEGETDKHLTALAQSINVEANESDEGESEAASSQSTRSRRSNGKTRRTASRSH